VRCGDVEPDTAVVYRTRLAPLSLLQFQSAAWGNVAFYSSPKK
jgi:hypothetical protein